MTRSIPLILRTLVCLTSLLLALSVGLRAQSVPLPQPQVITDRQGLPQAFVPSILQDKQGFIWVATRDGLCRYDGQRFKVFQPDPNGRPSLSFAGLHQLELDRHGRIWIVSERGISMSSTYEPKPSPISPDRPPFADWSNPALRMGCALTKRIGSG